MSKNNFYDSFEKIAPKLGVREKSFRKIFGYLDKLADPIVIVETGCIRIKDNFSGDGQSTLLFDMYAQFRGNGAKVYTVDINPEATKICSEVVSKNVTITTGDSVGYLNNLTNKFYEERKEGMLDLVPFGLVPKPTISGKGSLVHQYAVHTGAKLLFSNYQSGWIGFN